MDSLHTSPLLDLPGELRNEIYRLALSTSDKTEINKDTLLARKALLETSTQIRQEAYHFFYTKNQFLITFDGFSNEIPVRWLRRLDSAAALIQGIEVRFELSDAAHDRICKEAQDNPQLRGDGTEVSRHQLMASTALDQACAEVLKIRQAFRAAAEAGLSKSAVSFSTFELDSEAHNNRSATDVTRLISNYYCTQLFARWDEASADEVVEGNKFSAEESDQTFGRISDWEEAAA